MKLRFWDGDGCDALVRDWFLRAGSMPLSLRLILPYPHCPDSFFIKPDTCGCPSSRLFTDYWGRLTSFHGDNFTPAECFELLTRATRLVRCEFRRVLYGTLPAISITPLTHPDLTYLAFNSIDHAIRVFRLLDLLTLPKLRSLSLIHVFNFFKQISSFRSFLERTPSIHSFLLDHQYIIGVGDLTPILAAMPALTSLSLESLNITDGIFDILNRLGEPTGTFLPHIQTLALSTKSYIDWKDHFTPMLIDTLISRWDAKPGVARLLDFELSFPLPAGAKLDEKIAQCVSGLKDKGMRIHIGERSVSLVS
ncbi:hypothetical protein B0H19DRAFT_1117821 [Mycena capillaripes]|nr:hypothetical protein B0H19DRAFT_1117821 [Mycena capillaripes]